MVDFKLVDAQSKDGTKIERVLRHPRAIPGTSDGGAHVKSFVGGQYSTDIINWMVKEDGRMTLAFTVDGLDEIGWWIMGWGGRAKVIKPAKLREMVVEQLRAALQANKS